MSSQLKAFEEYITSLTGLGVFPTFNRLSNGWTCVLRNAANKQLMPFDNKEICWGETMLEALTGAVEGLNSRFSEPKELRKYIDTGFDRNIESLHTVKTAYAQ